MTTTEATGEWFDGIPAWNRGQRGLAIAIGILFVVLSAAAPLLWLCARPTKTISNVPPPEWTWPAFRSGEAMRGLEKHLKESSWVTYEMRGCFNEAQLALGTLENDRVVVGRDGWMYLAETLVWKPELLERRRAARRQVWKEALELTAQLDMRLLVLPVPDRVTIYPEFLPANRPVPAGRARLYDEILADLTAVGVPHVDLRGLFLAHKAAHPEQLLYYQRDTHWNLDGQLLAAEAVKRELESRGWDALVPKAPEIVAQERRRDSMVPGLVAMLGLRSEVDTTAKDATAAVRSLMEDRWWRPVHMRNAAGTIVVMPKWYEGAKVALCGTSFSETFGYQLPGTLGAWVDQRCVVPGGGSFRGMRKLATELGKNGFVPKVVVWEFVQRDYQGDWCVTTSLLR